MGKEALRLRDGSRVAIIGGGPAGCFFALYLLHYAAVAGIKPDITVYEQRDFAAPGPKGCKGCAGILSVSLLRNLDELGLVIPESIIMSRIEQYTVHSPYISVSISNPDKKKQIVSIYRGGGPRLFRLEEPVSFDAWLLREVQQRGARVEHNMVSRVVLGGGPRIEVAGQEIACDLVVLAAGVNTKALTIEGVDYVSPRTQAMAQDELYVGTSEAEQSLGKGAHAFLIPHSRVVFGSLVPKGPFINVSVLSRGKRPVSVTDFLNYNIVRSVLPEHYERACGCQPRALIAPARNYYADGFVSVGDAVVTRLYKDGTGSSLLTAREAARTAVNHGIARDDFRRYYEPYCRSIQRDNRWGRLLFAINDRIKDSRVFLRAQQRLIGDEQSNIRGPQPFTKAVWGMFTGSYSYRRIARMTLNPVSLARLAAALLWEGVLGLLRRRATRPAALHVGGKKVVILGSGFGGTYVLRRLVPALNRNETVETTMVSDENFFLFVPLLHEVAMGRIETRHIAYPIRSINWRDRFNFVHATVEKIDLKERQVVTSSGAINYDYLVLALGSITDMSELNPVSGNVFTLKTLRDSMLIRNHIIGVFEQAAIEKDPARQKQLLTFVVSGAGYTGVQVVTELRDFVHRHLSRFYKTIDPASIRIILVESGRKIVAELHTRLGAYTMDQLRRMGIEVRLSSRVTATSEDSIEINGVETLPAGTVLWTAGVVPSPRVAELDVARDDIGRPMVNEYLELPGFPGVYALGDCAHFKDPMTGNPIPPRAHTAVRQAKVVAHNILAELRGREKKLYHYTNTAEVVSLGASRAVFRFHGLRLYGFPARLIWLISYVLLVTGTYNRIRIIMDWTLSLIFGRDTTLIKLKR
ncbi:MAG: FAD-dependent oxidoreductase [Chloroflexi bacterium]|nr:FAD-dependent oxidoreductase [Chloroflexota bacterium]